MSNHEQNVLLDNLAGVLIRCFLYSFAMLLFSFAFYLIGADVVYNIHSRWFLLSRHDFDLIYYASLAFMKVCAILFFLFPWIAIRLMRRKNG